jgi:methylglyoxal synthase
MNIAIIAHDSKKELMVQFCIAYCGILSRHNLCATGTTGKLLADQLQLDVISLESGPLGGDQQIGALISQGEIDFVIFFWDPLEPLSHDPDIKALLRIAVVWNVPVACNRASADFMISSPLMVETYERLIPDYDAYRGRLIVTAE